MKKKKQILHGFVVGVFVALYLIVSIISTIHVISFFELSNPYWLSISLAIAFEIGAAASLAALVVLDRVNMRIVWFLFILLTAMQMMGNSYYAYVNLENYQEWVELFGLVEEETIFQKRILSIISGAILPVIALGFIKALVDYMKPNIKKREEEEEQLLPTPKVKKVEEIEESIEETVEEIEESIEETVEEIEEPIKETVEEIEEPIKETVSIESFINPTYEPVVIDEKIEIYEPTEFEKELDKIKEEKEKTEVIKPSNPATHAIAKARKIVTEKKHDNRPL